MTRITDYKKLINVYMGNWTDTGYGPDITGDLLGAAWEGFDDNLQAIVISGTVEEFIDWANDWADGNDEYTRQALLEAYSEEEAESIRNEIESRSVDISDPVEIGADNNG